MREDTAQMKKLRFFEGFLCFCWLGQEHFFANTSCICCLKFEFLCFLCAAVLQSFCFCFGGLRSLSVRDPTLLYLSDIVRVKSSVDILVFLSKSCMSSSIQSLVSHVSDGLVGLPVFLCLVGLPVIGLFGAF